MSVVTPAATRRIALLLLLTTGLSGCIVATVVDTAVGVAVGTVKVGAAVVGGTVKVAAAGVKAATGSDDDDKEKAKDKPAAASTDKPAEQPAPTDTPH